MRIYKVKGEITVPFDVTVEAETKEQAEFRAADEQTTPLESIGYSVDVAIISTEEVDNETNIWENQADGFSSRA